MSDEYTKISNKEYELLADKSGKYEVRDEHGSVIWLNNSIVHKKDGCAVIDNFCEQYSPNSKHVAKEREMWVQNGVLHRDGEAALLRFDGTKVWYKMGVIHRDDGPAVIFSDNTEVWIQNNKIHRLDGPAIIWKSSDKNKGQYKICKDGFGKVYNLKRDIDLWYIDGDRYAESEYLKEVIRYANA